MDTVYPLVYIYGLGLLQASWVNGYVDTHSSPSSARLSES